MATVTEFENPTLPPQGEWTWEDYLRLPEDGQRYEIIQGVLYVSPAPTFDHQFALGRLFRLLDRHAGDHNLGLVLVAPFDIRLFPGADSVQPDLMFFRPGNTPAAGAANFQGVPDLIVEVVSPGSTRLDQHIKFGAYESAGVPEYWLVDPRARAVTLFAFDPNTREYAELARAGADEKLSSPSFPGLEIPVGSLFP